jgi:hypothetical protein
MISYPGIIDKNTVCYLDKIYTYTDISEYTFFIILLRGTQKDLTGRRP